MHFTLNAKSVNVKELWSAGLVRKRSSLNIAERASRAVDGTPSASSSLKDALRCQRCHQAVLPFPAAGQPGQDPLHLVHLPLLVLGPLVVLLVRRRLALHRTKQLLVH